ncbi:MAG: hypothetical protein HQL74_04425 [Magnetococcales bacterium]|nr:hypothetical protein [Magnetococcales bacterium]
MLPTAVAVTPGATKLPLLLMVTVVVVSEELVELAELASDTVPEKPLLSADDAPEELPPPPHPVATIHNGSAKKTNAIVRKVRPITLSYSKPVAREPESRSF